MRFMLHPECALPMYAPTIDLTGSHYVFRKPTAISRLLSGWGQVNMIDRRLGGVGLDFFE